VLASGQEWNKQRVCNRGCQHKQKKGTKARKFLLRGTWHRSASLCRRGPHGGKKDFATFGLANISLQGAGRIPSMHRGIPSMHLDCPSIVVTIDIPSRTDRTDTTDADITDKTDTKKLIHN
jgi:hypothetical protein